MFLKNTPVVLQDNMHIRTLRAEHHGAILKTFPAIGNTLSPRTKCVVHSGIDPGLTDKALHDLIVSSAFSLNVFREKGALIIEHAFVIRHVRRHTVQRKYSIPGPWGYFDNKFKIDKQTDPSSIKTLFEACKNALEIDSGMAITFAKFNAAIAKTEISEKIIDFSICLESLFPSSTEIAFRFSLYNTLISTSDRDKRREVFDLLRKLYTLRSSIVHGTYEDNPNLTEQEVHRIFNIARSAILYKVEFLRNGPQKSAWKAHLEDIAIGIAEAA